MEVVSVEEMGNPVSQERVSFRAVSKYPYGENGESDDNTYARYTPAGELKLTINNPALLGKHKAGQKYYLDFTLAPE
jgi:hypothetical protein